MKLLTDDNLYFDSSYFALDSSLNSETGYYIYAGPESPVYLTTNKLKEYNGTIFYYNNNLHIYYDHMLSNIDPVLEDTSYVSLTGYTGAYQLYFCNLDGNNVYHPLDSIVLAEDYGERDKYLLTTTNTSVCVIWPDNVETPKYIYGQDLLPVFVWRCNATDDMSKSWVAYVDCSINGATHTYISTLIQYAVKYWGCMNCNVDPAHQVVISLQYNNGAKTAVLTLSYEGICAPYCLVWWDNAGFWQSLPFWGTFSNNYTNNEITNLLSYTSKYETLVEKTWSLKSDYVKKQRTYESLFRSNRVYLFDAINSTYKNGSYGYHYTKVLVTDSTFKESLARKAFKFEVNVKEDKKYISR